MTTDMPLIIRLSLSIQSSIGLSLFHSTQVPNRPWRLGTTNMPHWRSRFTNTVDHWNQHNLRNKVLKNSTITSIRLPLFIYDTYATSISKQSKLLDNHLSPRVRLVFQINHQPRIELYRKLRALRQVWKKVSIFSWRAVARTSCALWRFPRAS